VSDAAFRVEKTVSVVTTSEFTKDALIEERAKVVKSRDDHTEYCNKRIAEIDALVTQADALGIKTATEILEAESEAAIKSPE
jgi:hypothetical protein